MDDQEITIDPYDGITYTPGVVDKMEALGYRYNEETEEFEEVITNDNYANQIMIILIEPNHTMYYMPSESPYNPNNTGGSGGSSSSTINSYTGDCNKLEQSNSESYIRQVFIGHTQLKSQYDA